MNVKCWVLVALLAGGTARWARADGCYIPERAQSRLPSIPGQQAMIVYRGGEEKLVIASGLNSEALSIGWLVPVPAAPREMGVSSAGLIKTLSTITAPSVVHDLHKSLRPWRTIAFWMFLLSLFLAAYGFAWLRLLIFTIAGLVLYAVAVPNFRGGAGPQPLPSAPGGMVESQVEIGDFTLSCLAPTSARDLDAWLSANGYSGVPAAGQAIVSDYISQHWRFVAGKLRRPASGTSVPRPLTVTFPAARPVYPMRLTALAGNPVYLEIFFVGDQEATCDDLRLDSCDFYQLERTSQTWPPRGERVYDDLMPEHNHWPTATLGGAQLWLRGRETGMAIGHPAALAEIWPGAVITRFSGTVNPQQMVKDITFGLQPPVAFRRTLYSEQGAWSTAVKWTLPVFSFGLPVAILLCRRRSDGRKGAPFLVLAGCTGIWVLSLLIIARLLPVVDVSVTSGRSSRPTWLGLGTDHVSNLPASPPRSTLSQLRKDLADPHAPSSGPYAEEDSSGKYQLIERGRLILLRGYTRSGLPMDHEVAESSAAGAISTTPERAIKLRDPATRDAALWLLGESRDPTAVLAILDTLGSAPGFELEVLRALTRLTGHSLVDPTGGKTFHERWTEWWAAHRSLSRREWLAAGLAAPSPLLGGWNSRVAAQELARLGDAAGVEQLKEDLHPPGPYSAPPAYFEALSALAGARGEEMFTHYGSLLAGEDLFFSGGRNVALAAQNDCPALAEWLLSQGEDVNQMDNLSPPPLHIAASRGNLPMAKRLLGSGAKLGLTSKYGGTALHCAAQAGHVEMIRMLLAAGADVRAISYHDESPLDLAAEYGHLEAAKVLVRAGADLSRQSRYRRETAADRARAKKQHDVARFLDSLGPAAR